jgi:uncharacterized membrane protein
MNFDSVGGRKFFTVVLVVLLSSALVYVRAISDQVYSAVVIPVVLAFLTANVMQKKLAKQDEAP